MQPKADRHIQEWLNGPIDQATKSEILTLMRENPQELQDAFSTTLAFGTGGIRGVMGVGTNRINRYTIQMATQGLANYLLENPPVRERHQVFISYDSRHHSKEFAWQAARVLAGNGIGTYITCEIHPTPFVSFGVRQKECSAGIMITASHNPKEYNGYKVYWKDGGQVVEPHATHIVDRVKQITNFEQIKLSQENTPLIEVIDPELDLEYLDAIHKLQVDPKEDKAVGHQLNIVYTPLHGAGHKLVPRALLSWGFSNVHLVDPQAVISGDFPTVKSPNPEDPQALEMGVTQLKNTLADLLIATDPDADRMAVVVLHRDQPHTLNGNQIASVCLEYLCQMLKSQNRLSPTSAAITTIVSTDLLSHICQKYKVNYFEVLTGFKYIGELIEKWEQTRSHHFLFGAEESYGYLIGTHSRDKDAIVMSCLIAEVALLMKVEGRTLIDFLEEIYRCYGFFHETQRVISFPPGQVGMKKMEKMMSTLRQNPPKELARGKIAMIKDYKTPQDGLPSSNVLLYRLEDQSKIVVRPSGTEPKLKIYCGIHDPQFTKLDQSLKKGEEKIQGLLDAVEALF